MSMIADEHDKYDDEDEYDNHDYDDALIITMRMISMIMIMIL